MGLKTIFQILGFSALLISCQKVQWIPAGWRPPTRAETPDEEGNPWRQADSSRFLKAMGDFDGDGKADYAEMLIRQDRSRFGVFVLLSSIPADTMILACAIEDSDLSGMGIRAVPPGKYITAAGKGYNVPDENDPKEIILTCNAIDFFLSESANSYLVWNPTRKSFKRVWISD
jgi:hypothetical protein